MEHLGQRLELTRRPDLGEIPEITTWEAPTRLAVDKERRSFILRPSASRGRPKLKNRTLIDQPDRVLLGLGSRMCVSDRCTMRVITVASMTLLLAKEAPPGRSL